KFWRLLQRMDRSSVVMFLHVGLSQSDKAIGQLRFQLSDFLKFRNRAVKLFLFFSFCGRLQMLVRLRRNGLPHQPENEECPDHGFPGSRTSRNWSAWTSLNVW